MKTNIFHNYTGPTHRLHFTGVTQWALRRAGWWTCIDLISLLKLTNLSNQGIISISQEGCDAGTWRWFVKSGQSDFKCGKVCLICPNGDFSRFMHQFVLIYSVTCAWNKRPFTHNGKSTARFSTETSLIPKQNEPFSCLVNLYLFWFMDN